MVERFSGRWVSVHACHSDIFDRSMRASGTHILPARVIYLTPNNSKRKPRCAHGIAVWHDHTSVPDMSHDTILSNPISRVVLCSLCALESLRTTLPWHLLNAAKMLVMCRENPRNVGSRSCIAIRVQRVVYSQMSRVESRVKQ